MTEGLASLIVAPLARLLLYVGATVIIGRAALAVVSPSLAIASTIASRLLLQVGVMALLVAPWALLQLQLGALEMGVAEAPMLLRETAWGRGWIGVTVSAVLSAGALVLTRWRPTLGARGTVLTLVTAVMLAIAMGALGHAAADARVPVLARVIDALHVLAMGGWIGGLIMTGTATHDGPPSRAMAAWRAFSRAATVLAPMALLTGMASSALRLADATWPASIGTRYVQLLAAKVVVVLIVLAYGAVQRRRVHRLQQPPVRAVVQETAFAVAALAITAVLTGTEPPSAP